MLEKYDDISCHGNTCCAVSVQQNLTCFSSEETLPNWASATEISNFRDDLDTPATMIAALTIGDNHGCIQHIFRADCWGEADYCNVAMSCSAYPNCNSSEVPCDGFMEPMQQELVQIKTSRTNTCGLVYNGSNPIVLLREMHRTGRLGPWRRRILGKKTRTSFLSILPRT